MNSEMTLRLVYVANIAVAGWISLTSIFSPKLAGQTIFNGASADPQAIKLIGCLWLSIAILSLFGLFRPLAFSPVLLVQVIYKGTWLLVVALPAIRARENFPSGMAGFFVVWVCVLPFIIPWRHLMRAD
jgi:hypothetical protein